MKISETMRIGGKTVRIVRDMTPQEEAACSLPEMCSAEDKLEAQLLYTAMMTDTLLTDALTEALPEA